ncbi:uncharacterized protein [Asterias amurensis]|uniref:uncharacterized protein isoform X2 n=1 Tax=Asterias amurensis TaxID=7602 RepID=UPI003AB42611
MTSMMPHTDDGPLPTGRERRNSYLEVLSRVSSDLNFVASDLRKAPIPFKASSPKSPLAVTASLPLFRAEDRYHHLVGARNTFLGSNNNASTTPVAPAHYAQLPATHSTPHNREITAMPSPLLKSSYFPSSPSWFLSPHPVTVQQQQQPSDDPVSPPHPGHLSEDSMELSLLTRLVRTKPVWFLPNTQRTAAIHYLQGQPVGSFIVCRSRDKDNLVLTMKHPGKGTGLYIEKLPIIITENGVKLSNASEEYANIEDLILHHLYHEGALPCKLALPSEIMAARNIRALQSLAVFEEEFWVRITQCRQGISDKGQKEMPIESPREWSKFPVTPPAKNPLQWSLSEGRMAPKLLPPRGYVFMNKQPGPQTTATEQPFPASKTATTEPESSYMSMRNRNTESIALENRRLLKSWSFDETNSPFLTDTMSSSQTMARDSKRKSTDATLLAAFERQPMRWSTQSQKEYLEKNSGHYPPPQHSPPPPPKESSAGVYSAASVGASSLQSQVQRASGEYYKPFERTKQGHQPPSAFGFDQVYQSQAPPLPPKQSMTSPQQGGSDKYHSRGSMLPTAQHSSQYAQPKPQGSGGNYTLSQADLFSLERTPAETTEWLADPSMFGSIENKHYLGPILRPSFPKPPVTPGKLKPVSTLFEFDPLLLMEKQASTPLSQDVFSTPPRNPLESSTVLPQPDAPKSPPPCDVEVGVLVRLTLESSGDELTEEFRLSDQSRQSMDGGTEEGSEDSSNEDSEQTHDEEEEEETARGEQGFSTAETQSSVAHAQLRDQPQDGKTTASSNDGESQGEQNINRLSGVTASQKKKIKKKKKKKKKLSNFSRIQKYASVLTRGKTKKKKGDPTSEIQAAIHRLASNKSSYFSLMIECFVQNIKEKDSRDKPGVLVRNIRQFMSGMKNYLFNRREPDVDEAMDKYYNLTMAELDAIVEGAIHHYILLPLKTEIYKCFISDQKESGSLEELDHNIQLARAKTPEELGIKANYIPPESGTLEKFRQYFRLMEEAYSPIKKLEHLLNIVRTIYETVKDKNSSREESVQSMGADDFLPMFIYVLVQCEAVNIEVEADYMWGTLEPSMLSGEGGYYLTTLSSAICVLKQFESENNFTETKGFLSIMVAASGKNDNHIVHKALPVLPGMNAVDVCRILAHKMKIDNAHQYQLYLLSGDQEMPIGDSDCPLQMKEEIEANQKRACFFGYKIENQTIKWFT